MNSQHVYDACILEATARKLGNVHPGADFADMTFLHFARSAAAIAPIFDEGLPVGETILKCIRATRAVVPVNTNLGIVLLLAPLAAVPDEVEIEDGLPDILAALTVADAVAAYEAIRLANPAGLNDAPEQDVRDEPSVTLLEAMRLAADRDSIAYQYDMGFDDVFYHGEQALLKGFDHHGTLEAAILECQLKFLAGFLDSHIERKHGLTIAKLVRDDAGKVYEHGGYRTPEGLAAAAALDVSLRERKLNPGTTADLVTACLFIALRDDKLSALAPFAFPDYRSANRHGG